MSASLLLQTQMMLPHTEVRGFFGHRSHYGALIGLELAGFEPMELFLLLLPMCWDGQLWLLYQAFV